PDTPQYRTVDPDQAANWLREQLRADIPPINLSLSRAQLIGADVLPAPGLMKLGRLLYGTPWGVIAVYVAPRGTQFPTLKPHSVERRDFVMDSGAKDIGLYGWERNGVGYGLTASQPMSSSVIQNFALDAQRATDSPSN